jgi:TrmH family RNA methyltransferase
MIPHDVITSTANPRLREAARLREAQARRDSGLTLVDGGREVRRALAAGVALVELFVDEAILARADAGSHDPDATGLPSGPDLDRWLGELVAGGTRITLLGRTAFEKVAFGSRNEGCVGVIRFRPGPLDSWEPLLDRPVLIVEGVEKPGNLGGILRTADAAGLAGVIACDARTDPANPAVIRASLGTVFSVRLATTSTAETIAWCSRARRRVIAARPQGETPWHRARLGGGTAILLGSEAHGISPAWQEAADAGRIVLDSVHLPMHGAADSLNVSATAAVLAYESLRQANLD